MTQWLIVHPSDEMYGADRVLVEIVDALGAKNVSACWLPSDVSYPDRPLSAELTARGISVQRSTIPVLRRQYLSARGLARLAATAVAGVVPARRAARGADAVYLNTSAVLPMAALLKRRNRRVVLHVHEHWGAGERRLLEPFLRYCDTVISVSQAVADALPVASSVVYNGFPDIEWEPPPPDGTLQVLLASRWSSWKGHESFLRAWKHAQRADAHLTIVGGPPPAGVGVDVVALVHELDLQTSVTVLRERRDIGTLLAAAHVVVVPSIKPDPLPTIAIEAARAGRAVMASQAGGLPEIVSDGQTGWLLPPGDVEAWARTLTSVTIEEAARRGAAARAVYLEGFSVESFRSRLRDVVA